MKHLLIFTMLLFAFPVFAQITERDTLVAGTDSISVPDDAGMRQIFKTLKVTIKDTTGASAITDSFYVEKYDVHSLEWHRIGAKNMLTWANDQILVPGNGTTCTWIIFNFDTFAWHIRVRRINGATTAGTYVAGVKSMITWTGDY